MTRTGIFLATLRETNNLNPALKIRSDTPKPFGSSKNQTKFLGLSKRFKMANTLKKHRRRGDRVPPLWKAGPTSAQTIGTLGRLPPPTLAQKNFNQILSPALAVWILSGWKRGPRKKCARARCDLPKFFARSRKSRSPFVAATTTAAAARPANYALTNRRATKPRAKFCGRDLDREERRPPSLAYVVVASPPLHFLFCAPPPPHHKFFSPSIAATRPKVGYKSLSTICHSRSYIVRAVHLK